MDNLLKGSTLPSRKKSFESNDIDWDRCFICQLDSDKLQSSNDSRTVEPAKAYKELGDRILQFDSINALPVPLDIGKLSGTNSLGKSLFIHAAKFHKTCKLKFGNEKLAKAMQRREKEKQVNLEDHSRPKEPRRLSQPSAGGSTSCPKCFFCGGTADSERGQLHLAQSFRLDQRVRRCANLLEDSLLHAKLQNGDMIAQSAKYNNN